MSLITISSFFLYLFSVCFNVFQRITFTPFLDFFFFPSFIFSKCRSSKTIIDHVSSTISSFYKNPVMQRHIKASLIFLLSHPDLILMHKKYIPNPRWWWIQIDHIYHGWSSDFICSWLPYHPQHPHLDRTPSASFQTITSTLVLSTPHLKRPLL